MRSLAGPAHTLAKERAPGGLRTNDGGICRFVDDTDLVAAALSRFEQEHIIPTRNLRMQILFTRQPHLTTNDQVRS